MMRPYVGSWKRLAVQGAAAVLFGLATLVWPSISLWTLVLLWGAFAFVDGITALSAAVAQGWGDKDIGELARFFREHMGQKLS